MSREIDYPTLNIRSKRELARHISHDELNSDEALKLINDVDDNKYYRDHEKSDPGQNKYFRDASGTPLGYLLKITNNTLLKPYDEDIPKHIFGAGENRGGAKAASHLLGEKRERTLLKLDLKRFFDQLSRERVKSLFANKCGCTSKAAGIISHICCVFEGPRQKESSIKNLARGFATSPRLAAWCCANIFVNLRWLIKDELNGHDPRISIYIDDIGISASRVTKSRMKRLSDQVEKFLLKFDPHQPLHLNQNKRSITQHSDDKKMEFLGARLNRNTLSLDGGNQSKKDGLAKAVARNDQSLSLENKLQGLRGYQNYLNDIND